MRKIGITSKGQDLDDKMNKHFGNSPYVCIVEWDNNQIVGHSAIPGLQGNGCRCGYVRELVNENIEAIVTEYIGPGAFGSLNSAGIPVYQSTVGLVKDIATDYFNNLLNQLPAANVASTGKGHCGGSGTGHGTGRKNKP